MLIHSHAIKHGLFRSQGLVYAHIIAALVQDTKSVEFVGGMKICLTCSNLRLRVGPGSEVTSPVLVRVVTIGEHVISLDGVAKVLLLDSI
jgi:hypothetical protein